MITLKEHCIQNDISFIEKDGVLHACAMYDEDGQIVLNEEHYGKCLFYYSDSVDLSTQPIVFYSGAHLFGYTHLDNIEFKTHIVLYGSKNKPDLTIGSNFKYPVNGLKIQVAYYRKIIYEGDYTNVKYLDITDVDEFESILPFTFNCVLSKDGSHCKLINCDTHNYTCDMKFASIIPFEYRYLYTLYNRLIYVRESKRNENFYKGTDEIMYDIKGLFREVDEGKLYYDKYHTYFEHSDMGGLECIFELYESHRKLFYGLN